MIKTRFSSHAAVGVWLIFLSTVPLCLPAPGQTPPVIIHDATILTGTGEKIEDGTIVLQNGRISAIGKDAPTPPGTRIDATGKYVTPGLIDCYSTIGLRYEDGTGQPTARAADAFDRYADQEIRAAHASGITAIYAPARAARGFGGVGAVLCLLPHGRPEEVVLLPEASLCAAVGALPGDGPLIRVKTAEELRQRLKTAKDYRQAWEDYEKDVEEYEKKVAERARKEEQQQKDDKQPAAQKKDEKPKRSAKRGKKNEQKDELKKPKEPGKDRNTEMLLKAIDGELRVHVEAHQPADILNVLDIAEEFNLALVLEGATGAHLVAERLVKLHVPVVLTPAPQPLAYPLEQRRHQRADSAAALEQAGLDVYFGSGVLPEPFAEPHLALRVARALGDEVDPDAALQRITHDAAKLLGVEDQIGELRSGLRADLVVWSDHPFAPGARVERVFVGGREVYQADRED